MSWTLPELIDIPNLQKLMDRFHAATGIPAAITGSNGEFFVATGWQEICGEFHRCHPVTAERCRQSDEHIKTRLQTENYVEYKCLNGLRDLAKPVVIAGEHVATLFLGQFIYDDEEIDEEFFRNQALEFGFDLDRYMAALGRLPVFTREKVRRIMDFYTSFVDLFVDMGVARHRQKETEEALKVSETEKSLILDSTMDLVVYHDTKMKILWGNRRALDSLGMTQEEIAGRHCWELWHRRTKACHNCPVVSALMTGEPQEAEISSPDGREWYIRGFPVKDDEGRVKGIVEFCLDITERKRTEKALLESEEKFARAFRATPSVLVISNVEDGRYIEVNESFERRVGYRREEAVGRTSLELNIWESPEERARFLRTLREQGKVRDFVANFRSKSGELFVGLVSADVIEIKGEQCLLTLVNDITERKRMEEEIEILNTDLASHAMELEAANQELEAFNYSVSHDLRSPLTGISGYSQVLLELCGDRLGEECAGFVHQINESAKQMDGLIETLLNFSRLSHCEMTRETVDLTSIAKLVAGQLKMTEPGRQVTFTLAEGVKAEGDAGLLEVVMENLLGNAWKYTGKREMALIEFGVVETGGRTACFVRDNGAGFDAAYADKLFRPFERLPGTRDFAGHGIGLATVHRIIQRHGGRIWAEGEPEKGAIFYFTL